jgi:hypothetical protein
MLRKVLVILLCISSQLSIAEEVENLYVSLVAVADQSAESKQGGISEALKNVLVKLTGNGEILQLSRLSPSFDNASTYIDALSFQDLPAASNRASQDIRNNQLPVLPSNRPKLLVWVVIDDSATGREFLGQDSSSLADNNIGADIITELSEVMTERGIPYMLPTFDLEDQLALPIESAWNLQADKIQSASQRYSADGWVALRFYRTSSGDVRGAWVYQVAGRRQLGDFNAERDQPLITSAVNNILNSLTGSFSYIPRGDINSLLVEITGINTYSDYQRVNEQFKKLEIVSSFDLFSTRESQITLSVSAEGGAALLHKALVRSGYFRSRSVNLPNESEYLVFDWTAK